MLHNGRLYLRQQTYKPNKENAYKHTRIKRHTKYIKIFERYSCTYFQLEPQNKTGSKVVCRTVYHYSGLLDKKIRNSHQFKSSALLKISLNNRRWPNRNFGLVTFNSLWWYLKHCPFFYFRGKYCAHIWVNWHCYFLVVCQNFEISDENGITCLSGATCLPKIWRELLFGLLNYLLYMDLHYTVGICSCWN